MSRTSGDRMMPLPVTARGSRRGEGRSAVKKNTAFTLIEILVVVSIIALLASLLMPALRGAMHVGMEAHCRSQLHQVSTAISMYMVDHQTHGHGGLELLVETALPVEIALQAVQA